MARVAEPLIYPDFSPPWRGDRFAAPVPAILADSGFTGRSVFAVLSGGAQPAGAANHNV